MEYGREQMKPDVLCTVPVIEVDEMDNGAGQELTKQLDGFIYF